MTEQEIGRQVQVGKEANKDFKMSEIQVKRSRKY